MFGIFDAIIDRNLEEVERNIEENPKCVHIIKDNCKWTPLDDAIARGNPKIVKLLWEKKGRPNLDIYRDGEMTPVHWIVRYHVDYVVILKWIIAENVLPLDVLKIKDDYGWTPFDHAIASGRLETAKYLWEIGGRPNIDIYSRDGFYTPAHWVAYCGHTETLEWAFKENILPLSGLQIKTRSGCTPLDKAISENQWETASLLRRLPVDPVFLAMHRVKRDDHQMCVLRRLPNELLDMVVDEVARRFHLQVVW